MAKNKTDYQKLKHAAYEIVVVLGQTQKRAAEMVGVPEKTISEWATNGQWRELRIARQSTLSDTSVWQPIRSNIPIVWFQLIKALKVQNLKLAVRRFYIIVVVNRAFVSVADVFIKPPLLSHWQFFVGAHYQHIFASHTGIRLLFWVQRVVVFFNICQIVRYNSLRLMFRFNIIAGNLISHTAKCLVFCIPTSIDILLSENCPVLR